MPAHEQSDMNNDRLTEQVLSDIASMFGKIPASYDGTQSGYRNMSHFFTTTAGERLNFILYKDEPDIVGLIKRTNGLGHHVAAKGLPVRSPVDERIIAAGRRFGSLYGYLEGETIPWEAYTMKHIKLLGFALARFHAGAQDYEGELPAVEDVYMKACQRMAHYFAGADVQRAMQEKLGITLTLPDWLDMLEFAQRLPDRVVLHMDFVRSNLLFGENTASTGLSVGSVAMLGILDLEKAAKGSVLFDLARTLAFLLVDCDKPAIKVQKYFLESGYQKRGGGNIHPIAFEGADLLDQLTAMFLVYDFYKFLRQNPYESLSQNHHYIKTVAQLINRGIAVSG